VIKGTKLDFYSVSSSSPFAHRQITWQRSRNNPFSKWSLKCTARSGKTYSCNIWRYATPFTFPSKKYGPKMTPFPQSPAQTVSFARESLLLKLNSGGCPLGAYRRTLDRFRFDFHYHYHYRYRYLKCVTHSP
jgi:hypothetical protein